MFVTGYLYNMIFYTQLFASKKGALAQIWLAAHWEKKITKAQVFECDVEKTVKYLMDSKVSGIQLPNKQINP